MSIEVLQQMAARRLPLDCTDDDLRDHLLVLRSAGLIAAFALRLPRDAKAPCLRIMRVLAITPDGRRLLRKVASASALPPTAGGPPASAH